MANSILIVDGHKARLKRLSGMVSEWGYPVLHAASGTEALGLVASAHPQAVLVGGRPSDQDVDELVRAIKRRFREVEIVVVAGEAWLIEALRHVAAGFVLTPVDPLLLDVALERAIERARLRRRLRQRPVEMARQIEQQYYQRLETERFLTVKQIVDKLSTFIGRIARDVEGGVRYFNEIPYFVSIHDRRGRILAANRSYRVLLGGQAGDSSGLVYEGKSGAADECPVGRTLRSANAQESREVLRYRSGAQVPVIVHTAPIYNNDGDVELVLEVSAGTQDIDQLRDELRHTQQRYQMLFDAVPCYLAGLDRQLRFTTANRCFVQEFGDKTGVSFREVFRIEDDAFSASPIAKTFKEGKARHGEVVLTTAAGRRYHLLVWTSPMATAAGKLMQVLLIFLDITQIRELQSSLASLGLMIGSISHSIKGVLTGLDAGVYLLNKGFSKRDDAQIQSGLEIVRSMAERIRKMVLDILSCTKERELQYEPVDVRQFFEAVAHTVKPYFDAKAVDLVCTVDRDLGLFEVDPGLLESALVNVLENAADACAAEGSAKSHRVVFQVEGNAEVVGFLVEDNGIGMTPEQLKNLFTVFFSTKGQKGTGLGLYIADRVIRQHGGTITVDSAAGRGSRFGIMIPRRPSRSEIKGDADAKHSH